MRVDRGGSRRLESFLLTLGKDLNGAKGSSSAMSPTRQEGLYKSMLNHSPDINIFNFTARQFDVFFVGLADGHLEKLPPSEPLVGAPSGLQMSLTWLVRREKEFFEVP